MALSETNVLRFFAGALYQFELSENKGKEQSNVRQVTGSSRTKFLDAPLTRSYVSVRSAKISM